MHVRNDNIITYINRNFVCAFYKLFCFCLLAGADFGPLGSSLLTFSIGNPTIECVDFNITDDMELESDHDFTVHIGAISSMAPHAMIGTPNFTIVTIIDNDGKYKL